jgi:D-cysteine desulfhydrase
MRLEVDLERVPLGEGPTPVRELTHLGEARGQAPIWIKDDGAYSELGGNKARKLEWLLADASRRGKRTILTGGGLGTNHGLATSVFGRRLGMRTVLVLVPQPETEQVRDQLQRLRESGAELHFARGLLHAHLIGAGLFAARTSPPFNTPYVMRPGGSMPLGCVGYVQAALELRNQVAAGVLPPPSHVVVALGSGGTAAGLAAGLKVARLPSRLVCVLVTDVIRLDAGDVARLANRTLRVLSRHGRGFRGIEVNADEIDVRREWLGAGYGHWTAGGRRALELLADHERVTLDPTYTAKAMAAVLELNRSGAFGEGPVLYWHTFSPPTVRAGDEVAAQAETPGPRGWHRTPAAPEARSTGGS